MADILELIARLEAVEVGSRELDCEIAVLLDGFYICTPRYEGAPVAYGYVDEDGAHVEPGHGGAQMVPWYSASLDAALALAERVLPGWYVGVQPWFHTDPDRVMSRAYLIRPDWKRWNPVGDDWCDQHHGRSCATPALAVVAAILRAIQHGYEAAGEVSPNLKAKAQGEGGHG